MNIKNSFLRAIVTVLLSFAAVFCLLVSCGIDGFPTWNNVYSWVGLSDSDTENEDYFQVMDVGQGDCLLLKSKGKSLLIDSGTVTSFDQICKNLHQHGIRYVDGLAVTHAHMDHVGCLDELCEQFKVKTLILPNLSDSEEGIEELRAARNTVRHAKSGAVFTAVPKMWFNVGNFKVTVLSYDPSQKDENDRSVVMMVQNGDFKFLLMGDATTALEEKILAEKIDLSCDVLKVGHHGSKESTSNEFLVAASPKYAVISCGLNNFFSHPHDEMLVRLEKYKINPLRTDLQGNITFTLKDGQLSVKTEH